MIVLLALAITQKLITASMLRPLNAAPANRPVQAFPWFVD